MNGNCSWTWTFRNELHVCFPTIQHLFLLWKFKNIRFFCYLYPIYTQRETVNFMHEIFFSLSWWNCFYNYNNTIIILLLRIYGNFYDDVKFCAWCCNTLQQRSCINVAVHFWMKTGPLLQLTALKSKYVILVLNTFKKYLNSLYYNLFELIDIN